MGTDARAILSISPELLVSKGGLRVEPWVFEVPAGLELDDFDPALLAGAMAGRPRFQAKRDGSVVFTFERLEDGIDLAPGPRYADGDTLLVEAITQVLGPLLGEHDDPRGVFLYPDFADPLASTYEGRVRELAHLGRFLTPHSIDVASSGASRPPSLRDAFAEFCAREGVDAGEVRAAAKQLRVIRPK